MKNTSLLHLSPSRSHQQTNPVLETTNRKAMLECKMHMAVCSILPLLQPPPNVYRVYSGVGDRTRMRVCTLSIAPTQSSHMPHESTPGGPPRSTHSLCTLLLCPIHLQASRNSCGSLHWCSIPNAKQDPTTHNGMLKQSRYLQTSR